MALETIPAKQTLRAQLHPKRYLSHHAPKEQLVALHGQNGSGKTTLLNILATRLKANQGSAKVVGFDVLKEARRGEAAHGLCAGVGGELSQFECFGEFAICAKGFIRGKGDVGGCSSRSVYHAKHKLVRSFSSGMKKRLAIAKLLLSDASMAPR
ncbi:MAG: ATP-binding cassette domain-containing protein [Deinococcales bacterium]